MKKHNKESLSFFFTLGVSLETWDRNGLLTREILPYTTLAQEGYQVTFYTWGGADDKRYQKLLPGIEIIPLMSFLPFDNKLALFSLSLLLPFVLFKKTRHTIIKTNQMWGSWTPILFHLLSGAPLMVRIGYELYEFHLNKKSSLFKRRMIYLLSKITYKMAAIILVTSQETKKFIANNFSIAMKKIHFHANYIDLERFAIKKKGFQLGTKCIYVGRLDPHKNLDKALSFIKMHGLSLDIVGTGTERKNLESQVLKMNLANKVKFLGKIPNFKLPHLLVEYDYFILFSKSEGSPKAMLEAMSCGVVPIANDTVGINNIITHQENGFLFDVNNLTKTSLLLVPEKHQQMGLSARHYVSSSCSLDGLLTLEKSLFVLLLLGR